MGAQTAKEPLALADAIWQALSTAEQALAADSDSSEPVEDAERNLTKILESVEQTDNDGLAELPSNTFVPVIESLNDAAAFLVQIDPDNLDELQGLRESLVNLAAGGQLAESACRFLDQAIEKFDAS